MIRSIATDKRGYPHNIFSYFSTKTCCGYSLEVPHRGTSNEYPQHMFLLRNKKDISIFRMKKAPYLLLWIPELTERFFFPKNLSFKIAMSRRVGGHLASSEVYLLVNLIEKPVHNAIRRFSCFDNYVV